MNIRNELLNLADEKYRIFTSSLLPGISNIIGVRLPDIKKIAARLAKSGDDYHLPQNPFFEEIMLFGMITGLKKEDIDDKLQSTEKFLPLIDNWSVCDSFCGCFKFRREDKSQLYSFIIPHLSSSSEFYVRFALVMLLKYFIDDEYIDRVLDAIWRVKHPGYYAKMAQAWAISACYIKYPELTENYLKSSLTIDDFTYNMALQKILDSKVPTNEQKGKIRSMKRKPAAI